jgi:hypothetical protein
LWGQLNWIPSLPCRNGMGHSFMLFPKPRSTSLCSLLPPHLPKHTQPHV